MHPPRFAHSNYIPHQNHWRPHGPRFGPMWSMQHRNNSNQGGHHFPNSNENYWCETCDRGFQTMELLSNHKQQHQKCNIDGCQFIAHPKVITKHIQMQHSTGLYKKIAKLDNPEEIQKWREERKKRYPTKENIEKRSAEIKEKIDRGEKMGMRNHRESKPHGRGPGIKRKFSQDNTRKNFKRKFQINKSITEANNQNPLSNNKKPSIPQREIESNPAVDNSKTLRPFTGILSLLDDTTNDSDGDIEIVDSIEDDEYIIMNEPTEKIVNNEPAVCGALTSLICNYESSDEESDKKSVELKDIKSEKNNAIIKLIDKNPSAKQNICLQKNINTSNVSEKSDDDSGPEESKIVKAISTESEIGVSINSNKGPSEKTERKEQNRSRSNTTKMTPKKFTSKVPSTLLEKLLRNEIRQERNIVLQCIRYIVKNNYFDNV